MSNMLSSPVRRYVEHLEHLDHLGHLGPTKSNYQSRESRLNFGLVGSDTKMIKMFKVIKNPCRGRMIMLNGLKPFTSAMMAGQHAWSTGVRDEK